MDAPIASSRITPMSMISSVMKPTASARMAIIPGRNSCRKVRRAAVRALSASLDCRAMPLIFCTPWEMPMAKIRNGTSIEYGSSPKPKKCINPSCQTTATNVVLNTAMVLRRQLVNHSSRIKVMTNATPKNSTTITRPSIRSPTFLAKPTI
ncbi:hypothetical protein PFLmoz3_02465 [Pseudomonas fluorescens]|uniref:Uncharacterized protein n=1 Tax=Pseudomonas fluorescens TaxID=294 RepID=A0A109LHQ5_PSEFL|nr:hypothetical protein PFLmoz3_02465 [Pseudomonas fluorescens]